MLKELKEKRAKAIADARAITEAAEKDNKRPLTEDETRQFDQFMDDQEKLRVRIEQQTKLLNAESDLNSSSDSQERARELSGKETTSSNSGKADSPKIRSAIAILDTPEYRSAFQKYLLHGQNAPLNNDEHRALSQGSNPDGGFLVPAEQMVTTLIKFIDDQVFIRQRATIHQLAKAVSLGIPSWDTDPADADWTSEVGTGSLDTAMKVGKRELSPAPLAKRVKISNTLLRNSVIPLDTLVLQRLAYKFAITEEKGFLTGNGANQPLGVFTASAAGISTGRDVATDNATTAPTFDGLKNAKYSIKAGYWSRLAWIFHRDCIKILAKIKDGEGRYIWQDGVVGSEPDTLMGFPVNVSEYAPNTFTTGLYVGILGDFSLYHIADSLSMSVQKLIELYAEANQTGFIGRLETDGMPVLEEGFARVKLG